MEVLKNCHIVTLEVLSGEVDAEAYLEYEKELERYNDSVERMNITLGKPEEPDFNIEYRKQKFNIALMDILYWYPDWDKKRECEIVILNYLNPASTAPEVINIKISEKEFTKLLAKFGATIHE